MELAEMRAQIKVLEEQERIAHEAQRKVREAAWTEFKSTKPYEYQSIPCEHQPFGSQERFPACRVLRRFVPDLLTAFIAQHGKISGDEAENRWVGMTYYRTDEGILTGTGGGHCILLDPKLCNDDEWTALCSGNIAAKYRR